MRNRLLASLIVCVALLTQLGASFWGAAATRDGYASCHRQIAAFVATDASSGGDRTPLPAGAPAPHDHASCSLCQLGFTAVGGHAPVLPARSAGLQWRVVLDAPESAPFRSVFNKCAPARAPPSRA